MNELIGIVACGGKSSRMQTDKSRLSYYAIEQRYHVYNLLSRLCNKVYISCNKNQASTINQAYSYIIDDDDYKESGPIASLLTAWKMGMNNDILLIGCDYPFLELDLLQKLINAYLKNGFTSCIYNVDNNIYEPLLAIYSFSVYYSLKQSHMNAEYSLQHFLKQVNPNLIEPNDLNSIKSIDTQSEFNEAINIIKSRND